MMEEPLFETEISLMITPPGLLSLLAPGVPALSLEWGHCVWPMAANCPERGPAAGDWRPPSVCSPSFCHSNFFHRFGRQDVSQDNSCPVEERHSCCSPLQNNKNKSES